MQVVHQISTSNSSGCNGFRTTGLVCSMITLITLWSQCSRSRISCNVLHDELRHTYALPNEPELHICQSACRFNTTNATIGSECLGDHLTGVTWYWGFPFKMEARNKASWRMKMVHQLFVKVEFSLSCWLDQEWHGSDMDPWSFILSTPLLQSHNPSSTQRPLRNHHGAMCWWSSLHDRLAIAPMLSSKQTY